VRLGIVQQLPERSRWNDRVIVKEEKVASVSEPGRLVVSPRVALVRGVAHQYHSGKLGRDHACRTVGGAIIHDNDLQSHPLVLRQERGQTRAQEFPTIPVGDAHGDIK
jgi:hypothetical protein